MVLRPLPTPYRIGTDVCFIPRIRRLLLAGSHHRRPQIKKETPFLGISSLDDKTNSDLAAMSEHLSPHFLAKLLRPAEIATLKEFYNNVAGTMAHDRLYEHIAGRWAAKEAIIKAASQSYRGHDGPYMKPTFHDIFIWTSNKRLQAAIISEPLQDKVLQRTRTSTAQATGEQIETTTLDRGLNFKQVDQDPQDATSELDGDMVEISISHDEDYAIATALFCDPSPD